jgi:hypothetical protein
VKINLLKYNRILEMQGLAEERPAPDGVVYDGILQGYCFRLRPSVAGVSIFKVLIFR